MSQILQQLEAVIAARRAALAADPGMVSQSYVARQLAKGPLKLAEKLGEEAVETLIAAVAQDDAALVSEAADLLFHLLLVLGGRDLSIEDVLGELERRVGRSGVAEKESRDR